MRLIAVLSVAFLAAAAPPAAATPFVVRLGTDRVVLDTPAGFSDSLALGSPRLQEIAESLTSPSDRVLVFSIGDGDLKRFMGGDSPDLARYMTVAVPVRLEREQLGASEFAALAEDMGRGMAAVPEPGAYRAHLDKLPHGQLHRLAELRRSATLLSLLQGTRLPARKDPEREKPRYLLASTTLVLLRGKALSVSVFTGYAGDADLAWLEAVTRTWVDELQRLNRNP